MHIKPEIEVVANSNRVLYASLRSGLGTFYELLCDRVLGVNACGV